METTKQYTAKDFKSDQYVRWCPGCGNHAILNVLQKSMAELGIPPHETVVISGIGCSSRLPYYINSYGFHTIHGRGAAIATGVKVANPGLTVWQITGDGDCLAIGGYDTGMVWGLEDWEFYIRLLDEQSVVVQLEEPLFFYRIKENSRNTTATLHLHELHQIIYSKHMDIYGKLYDDPIALLRWLQQDEETIHQMKAELEHYQRRRKNKWYRRLGRRLRSFFR